MAKEVKSFPVAEIHMRDAFVYCDRERKRYFLFGTTLADGAGNVDPFFEVYESEDLLRFTGPFVAFQPPKGFWGVRNYWAPEVYRYQGRYYMFASFKGGIGEERGTGVLTAEKPEGPYRPHSERHVTLKDNECLDGTLYVSEEGDPWIIFCHEWTQNYYGTIKALPLSHDLTRALSQEPITIVDTHDITWIRKFADPRIGKDGYLTDAPFPYRTKTGALLLLWSSYSKKNYQNGQGGYTVAVTVSPSGSIKGPWEQQEELLLDENCGHSSIFTDLDGQLRLCTHSPDTPHGAEGPKFLKLTEKDGRLMIVR
jgi:arabinan endo-1,5-alpha-L-arabinosidase